MAITSNAPLTDSETEPRAVEQAQAAGVPPMMIQVEAPLDPEQLRRIEAVHRGFFYQHLYAVAVLLSTSLRQGTIVAVERDEDIEVRAENVTHYIQVKTRQGALQRNHLQETLERFDELRALHRRGDRMGDATFTSSRTVTPVRDWPLRSARTIGPSTLRS